ncbi:hypothetical protein BKA64DRAFT_570615, partial [Cadophora sp. MPI-SDFR-AT-0126]
KCIRSNFAKYQKRIIFSVLPTTFRDAITITRELGFRYIWIDAFVSYKTTQTTGIVMLLRWLLTTEQVMMVVETRLNIVKSLVCLNKLISLFMSWQ